VTRVRLIGQSPRDALAPLLASPEWSLVDDAEPSEVVVVDARDFRPRAGERGVVSWCDDPTLLAPAIDGGCPHYLYAGAPPALVYAVLRRAAAQACAAERHSGQLALVSQSGRSLGAMRDMHEIARRLLVAVTKLAGGEGGSIWLWADDDGLVCRFAEPNEVSMLDVHLPPGEGVVGWVARRQQVALVDDVGTDPRFAPEVDSQTGYHTGSLLAVPLEFADTVVGVLEVVHSERGAFDEDDLVWVQMLASPAALALENVRAVRRLAERNGELRERNAALDAFAHSVAHDLKRPLVSLVGLADILDEEPEDAAALVPRIARLGRIAYQIVEELLLLAQLRGAQVPRVRLDMAAVVAEIRIRLADDVAAARGRVIEPTHWPSALGHGPWVGEVWANLLSNALKYGGAAPIVTLGADPPANGEVRFWCRDEGPGLESAAHTRVFEAFTRATDDGEGLGLGLSIASRIVDRLEGRIGVDSAPGQGACFWFTLPVA